VIGVHEDRDTADAVFANVTNTVAVRIVELHARKRDAVLEIPFLEGGVGAPLVRTGLIGVAHLDVEIDVGRRRIERMALRVDEIRKRDEDRIIVCAAAG